MRLPPLTPGTLIRRYKRFLAEVDLGGATVTAHCPNTGSMLGLAEPGTRVWLSHTDSGRRKHPYGWELTELPHTLVGVNTGRANALFREALEKGVIEGLKGLRLSRAEVPLEGSRLDFLLEGEGTCYVEVKSVTLAEGNAAYFPDAVTARGLRHLKALAQAVEGGHRGVLFFCVQREDAAVMRPAAHIDPAYAVALREVAQKGVEVMAYRAELSMERIELVHPLPVDLS
ncbi:MAG: DNA/RNA nuclease SfsA [Gammaproteobacteria bacterium]|nr:MAG: DNA/RNA nuclease SfsA [Gammaproteobacteria bacterium]